MLKAAIYDPYLDTLGGGERYCLTVAETLLKSGHQVDLFWSGDPEILSKAKERFDLEIDGASLIPDIFNLHPNKIECLENPEDISKIISHPSGDNKVYNKIKQFISRFNQTRRYDLLFYISDWSIPFIFSKNNLLHVQVPFAVETPLKDRLLNSLKMRFISHVICNSDFTNRYALSQFGSRCSVLYPPVDVDKFSPAAKKENIILSVGRFDNILNSKKQDLLIDSFRNLLKTPNPPDWKLILAGGSKISPDKNSYLLHLKTLAVGLPIEFYVNSPFPEIKDLYSKSKIFWHAAGYGIDETLHPELTEHFGMAPVEAMAAGTVPIVLDKGGLSEVVTDGIDGYLWDKPDTLIAKTRLLISSPDTLAIMSQKAALSCQRFSKDHFVASFQKFISHA